MNVLSDMLDIRNSYKQCHVADNHDLNHYYYGSYCILKSSTIAILKCDNTIFLLLIKHKAGHIGIRS